VKLLLIVSNLDITKHDKTKRAMIGS
jgi:hypothetical protein